MEDKKMKKSIIAATALVFLIFAGSFTSGLLAQEGRGIGRLKGYVLDTDKNPIEGVKLTIEYKDFNHKLTTTSGKDGKFVFIGLGVGIIQVIAEKEGFIRGGIGLKVSGVNKNPEQHIVLKRVEEVKEIAQDQKNELLRSKYKKADALYKERKFEAALAGYQDFLAERPDLYKIGINIANCYLEMQRFDEAIKALNTVLEKILAEKPDVKGNVEVAKIYATLGDIAMRRDDLKKAEGFFKKSIDISPDDHALAYNVAEILFAAGKTDDAIKYYDKAIQINPKWPKSYMQRGYAYLNKGDIKIAIESFKKYLELVPDSAEADGVREVIKSLQ
jgi:cytochrome c-type biogenesis protein CcmH/NrfG